MKNKKIFLSQEWELGKINGEIYMNVKTGTVVYANVSFEELHVFDDPPYSKLINKYPNADVIIVNSHLETRIIKNTLENK